jgi:hypothetical protein
MSRFKLGDDLLMGCTYREETMRRCLPFGLVACLLAVSLMVGCSGDDSSESTSTVPTREVDQTGKTVVDVTPTLTTGAPDRKEAAGRPTLPRDAVPIDTDEPGAPDAAPNDNSLAMAIPFSPVSTDPPEQASRDGDRRADEDDLDAPVVVAKPEFPQEARPILNNGRGGMLVPPAKKAASNDAEKTGTAPRADTPSVAQPQSADTDAGESSPNQVPAAGSATADPNTPADSQLAAQYVPLDQDGDGQIGLYEWPREKLAEFQKLDSNKDGFLTPEELVEKTTPSS